MKLSPTLRYHRLIFAGMLFVLLSFGTKNPIFSISARAQTSAATPAPAGANIEKDKETGKPVVTTPSGLKYVDIVVGTGPAVKTGDHVSVKYVGKLLDGTKFDASADHPQMGPTFDYQQGVTSLIVGWTEGTSTMKVGGKRKLIIPPQLGYGMQGAGDAVPPNATLIFEIEMVSDADAKTK
jgi:FKBP-type peptidyl-prolyl cis-trans isomerase